MPKTKIPGTARSKPAQPGAFCVNFFQKVFPPMRLIRTINHQSSIALLAKEDQLSTETIRRWCDWLDAAVHLQTHRRWHLAPACFDPDPEKRYLAALGNAQRNIARLTVAPRPVGSGTSPPPPPPSKIPPNGPPSAKPWRPLPPLL